MNQQADISHPKSFCGYNCLCVIHQTGCASSELLRVYTLHPLSQGVLPGSPPDTKLPMNVHVRLHYSMSRSRSDCPLLQSLHSSKPRHLPSTEQIGVPWISQREMCVQVLHLPCPTVMRVAGLHPARSIPYSSGRADKSLCGRQ